MPMSFGLNKNMKIKEHGDTLVLVLSLFPSSLLTMLEEIHWLLLLAEH
jgi:hypothetical protein